jgi:hypothetical protein
MKLASARPNIPLASACHNDEEGKEEVEVGVG